ncbi:hypothetical protein [Nonomuraea sp. NPDC005650]|uniref:hypothetical protein n=1 Tax=Nonomuraea sp. NPDC005650 TaxID=3157045 RepID=UPI0033A6B4A3
MFGKQHAALPPAPEQAPQAPAKPRRGLLERAVRAVAYHVVWTPIRWAATKEAQRMWRHRDFHTPWWTAAGTYVAATIAHVAEVPWWATMPVLAAAVTGIHRYLTKHDLLPITTTTATGAAAALATWAAAAIQTDPLTGPAAIAWGVLTLATTCGWGFDRRARHWRKIRERVRVAVKTLPKVLSELGFPRIIVKGSPTVSGSGRVEYPLLLPVGVTRRILEKKIAEIESGMHWPAGSIKEIVQDPRHNSAARVILIQHETRITAQTVAFDPPETPRTAYDRVWLGNTEGDQPFYLNPFVKGHGGLHAAFGGMTGSAKSNLMRLIAMLYAHCPDLIIWVIDLKSGGQVYRELLPRIDRLAVTPKQAGEVFADLAAMPPLRAELLLPEHNQVLPVSLYPGVLVLGDEMSRAWGKTRKGNDQIVDDSDKALAQVRAYNAAVLASAQYWNKDSVHPKLLANFTNNFAGRTRQKADSQFLLRGWSKPGRDTTHLPAGAFYHQQAGDDGTDLIFTPEVTDLQLAAVAAETAHLAPALEESTATRLPYYRDRWADLPDNLIMHCSEDQQLLVHEARARRKTASLRASKNDLAVAAAADNEPRVEVTERLDIPTDVLLEEIADPHLRALVAVHLSPGWVSTAESDAAVAGQRGRKWASERRKEWRARGLVEAPERGKSRRIVGEERFVAGALKAEEVIRARRTDTEETPDTETGETPP